MRRRTGSRPGCGRSALTLPSLWGFLQAPAQTTDFLIPLSAFQDAPPAGAALSLLSPQPAPAPAQPRCEKKGELTQTGEAWGLAVRHQLSSHLPPPRTCFLSQPLKDDLECQLEWAGHRPGRSGLEAHYHGREGSFSPPPFLPPVPFSLLASLLQGQTEPKLTSGPLDRPHSSSRSPDTSCQRRPRSFLLPCRPSPCSFWVCSRQCHLPAVNKVIQDGWLW